MHSGVRYQCGQNSDSQGIRYAEGYLMMVPSAAASTVIFL